MSAELALEAELEILIDRLGIFSPNVQAELRAEPGRACRVLERALARSKQLRAPAAYAIAQFRAGADPGDPRPKHSDSPLTVEELEGALDYARRHHAPADVIASIELELELARYHEDQLGPASKQ